jgi:hypothetical protein
MLLLLLLLVSGALATLRHVVERDDPLAARMACRTLTRDTLLSCFSQFVDTNHDDSLSSAEVGAFLTAQHIPAQSVVMRLCDLNKDGALTSADWTNTSACVQDQAIITRACYVCVDAGWDPLAEKKKQLHNASDHAAAVTAISRNHGEK